MRYLLPELFLAVLFLQGCTVVPSDVHPPTIRPSALDEEQLKPIDYQVMAGDTLEVFVWQNPDLSRDIIVRPDGKISVFLIGDTVAQGKTLTEIDDEITGKLSEYIISPQVSVTVKKFAGEKVILLGEVVKPGVYTFVGKTSFLDMVAEAGGLTRDAHKGNALIIRGEINKETGKSDVILLDVNEILSGNLRHNIVIYPRDIIYVASKPIADVARYLRDYVSPILGNLMSLEIIRDRLSR
ncbi:MAG: polysaccharide biosynthesis/export family protein [Planctomycetota bacterium]|nr:polysaccharide biosynthesis/export family protein [Planctomycetota bacterium]MDI6787940.1 polysaccharide biosynthesis/export family protein [Planctomycetota bacterium]